MSAEDFEIWKRWWPKIRAGTVSVWFDVGLGLPAELPQTEDAALMLMWIRNNQRRADVILEREDEVWLVELRMRANPNALGRVLVYMDLLAEDNPFTKPVVPFLVTDREDPDTRRAAEARGVRFVVV